MPHNFFRYFIEVIVIIGSILGAFALDRWNENRKEDILQRNYLDRILSDLKKDSVEIAVTLDQSFQIILYGNHILSRIDKDYISELKQVDDPLYRNIINDFDYRLNSDRISDDKIGSLMGNLSRSRDLDVHDYTYNEIISSGKFDVIKDHNLRGDISNYYGILFDLLSAMNNIDVAKENYLKSLIDNNIPVMNAFPFEKVEALRFSNQYITSLKNLISAHLHAFSLFQDQVVNELNYLLIKTSDYRKSLD